MVRQQCVFGRYFDRGCSTVAPLFKISAKYTVLDDYERFVQKTTSKTLLTTVTLASMYVEVAIRERKLACRQSKTRGETINKSTEETYEKHFVSC